MTRLSLAFACCLVSAVQLLQSCGTMDLSQATDVAPGNTEPAPVSPVELPDQGQDQEANQDIGRRLARPIRTYETIHIAGFLRDVDGSPFSGEIELALVRVTENSHSVVGPYPAKVTDGEFQLPAAFRSDRIALHRGHETTVEITALSEGSGSLENKILTSPGVGRLATLSYLPADHFDAKPYELELQDLQFALPPQVGELHITGPQDTYVMGLGNGDFAQRILTTDDRGARAWPSYQHELPTGVTLPLFSWADVESFSVWQEDKFQIGLAPQVFPVGTSAKVTITGSAKVALLCPESMFAGKIYACAFPSDSYSPFVRAVNLEGDQLTTNSLEASIRAKFLAPFLGFTQDNSEGKGLGSESRLLHFGDMPVGSYVFEVWSGDSFSKGAPSATLTAEVTKQDELVFTMKP